MTGDPVRLSVRTPREEFHAVVVKQLEDLLEAAKAGRIESLLAIFETSDYDGMNWRSSGTLNRSQTVGRIEILKQVLIRELLEGQ